jgi:hypothetical protein
MAVSKFTNSSSANDFNLNIGSTYSTVTLTQEYPAGAYSFTSVANDTSMDLYFYNAQGFVCYTNTKGVIAPTGFNKVVIIGGTVGDVLSFSYKTTFATVAETNEVLAGPVILSTTPTSLPNVNSSTTVTGLNFATDVAATFTGNDNLPRLAKSVVRGSANSLVVTRPDTMPVAYSPYTLTVTNPSVPYQPTGSNSNTISVTSGVNPIWVTSPGQLSSTIYYGASSATIATISATDADGGSSVTYALISGALPAGITLNTTTGVISGTPTLNSAATYNFTLSATDSGNNSTNQTFSIVVGSDPAVLYATPFARLDASNSASLTLSGSNVTSWADISGNGNTFGTVFGTPQYQSTGFNGKPTVYFNGSSSLATNSSSIQFLSPGYTIFKVMYITGVGMLLEHTVDANTGSFYWYANTGNSIDYTNAGVSSSSNYNAGSGALVGSKSVAVYSYAGTHATHYIRWAKSNVALTANSSNNPGFSTVSGKLYLMSRAGTNISATGYVSELIIYKSILTTTQIQDIENYLYAKWGM